MSTRFYAGQKDYIVQLNLMDEQFLVASNSITDDTVTNAVVYPMWSADPTGFATLKVSSTKLSFNPSTGALTAPSFVGALTGNASTATNATNADNFAVTNDITTNAVYYPVFVTANSGDRPGKVASTKLTFNPSTGALSATTFVGALTGNATTATTATNAINVGITNDTTSNVTVYPTWSTATSGNAPTKISNTKLTFNPSTGVLTATGFVGALTGNASSSTNATNSSNVGITNDIATNAAHYPTFVTGTSGNLPNKVSSTKLSFNPSTGVLTAIGFNGDLVGDVTGNVSGTAANVTGVVAATKGGTGQSVYAIGDILYASSTTAVARLAAAAANNVLVSGTTPSWGKVGLTTHVSGTLPIANGGTAATSATVARTNLGVPAVGDVVFIPSGLSVDISSTNLNTRVLSGFYRGGTLTNAPDTGYWFVTVEAHDGSHVKQTVTAYGDVGVRPTYPAGTTFVRIMVTGAWGNWQSIGGGATGGGSDKAFYENDVTINTSYSIGTNKNAMSAGPITIVTGATVTVPTGSVWTIV